MAQWYNVKTNPPKETNQNNRKICKILACYPYLGVKTVDQCYLVHGRIKLTITGKDITKIVTHWMPMPEPPEDDE